jgi:hypothetical protein
MLVSVRRLCSRPHRARAGLFIVGLMVLLAACSSGSKPAPTNSPPTSPSPTANAVNPLTGLAPSKNKVIAVKIDDTAAARPQAGLNQADIVYVIEVEGGLTRLMAIFNTHLPTRVGPVRSTRNDDPDIARQFGPIIYVASGGDKVEYRPLDRSDLHAVINDRGGPGFSRDPHRPAPYNLFVNLETVAKNTKGPTAKSIGLHWSLRVTNPSHPGMVVHTMVGGTPVQFRWNVRRHLYLRYVDGHVERLENGSDVSTTNVVVQFVRGHVFRSDIDDAGNPAWFQHTIGSGHVAVFRNGRVITGTWKRPAVRDGTQLLDDHGKPITLATGRTWFVLVNNGTKLTD